MTTESRKIVWITGASTGIGRATALELARQGWVVAATARREALLQELANSAEALDGKIAPFAGDITNAATMKDLVEQIETTVGPIDLALLNAGNYLADGLADFTATRFKDQYNVNVFGTVNCLDPVLTRFRARNKGHIAIVASVAGYRGLPRSIAYGSSKAALINMCEALAIECVGTGIKVQVVCPGFIKTPLTDANDFPMPFMISAEEAATSLVKQLDGPLFEITFPRIFSVILRTIGLLPAWLYIKGTAKARPVQ